MVDIIEGIQGEKQWYKKISGWEKETNEGETVFSSYFLILGMM